MDGGDYYVTSLLAGAPAPGPDLGAAVGAGEGEEACLCVGKVRTQSERPARSWVWFRGWTGRVRPASLSLAWF
jgi:hypothetical protein